MDNYDTIIVGAGIGGLVCGCYLAKFGLKVLIIEQHFKPGGCCTSFERKGYNFDVGVHYLGSMRRGALHKILDELEIKLQTTHVDPTDKIILPDNVVYLRAQASDTIKELKKKFPKDAKNIDRFFNFILDDDFLTLCHKVKTSTFEEVLNIFLTDYRLKATLNILLGNIGLSAKYAAAIPVIVLFREYILDNGYYPRGGMQSFSDKLAENFKHNKGTLLLSNRVEKIIPGRITNRVLLESGKEFSAKTIVSNADATETFCKLIDKRSEERSNVRKMVPSSSMFLVYLGLKTDLTKILKEKVNLWYFTSYDIDRIYSDMRKNVISAKQKFECVACSFPSFHDSSLRNSNKTTATLFMLSPFKPKEYWERNKVAIGERMINKISEITGDLNKHIEVKTYGTPYDFYRYTLNRNGAFVGWLSTLKQTKSCLVPQKTSIRNIYLVGHWATLGYHGQGGIPNVAFSGKKGALAILKRFQIKT